MLLLPLSSKPTNNNTLASSSYLTAVSVLEMTQFVTLAPAGYSFPFDCFSLLLQMVVSTLYKQQKSLHKRRFETTEKNP